MNELEVYNRDVCEVSRAEQECIRAAVDADVLTDMVIEVFGRAKVGVVVMLMMNEQQDQTGFRAKLLRQILTR